MNTIEMIQDAMRTVFLNETLNIAPELTALDVDGWDSLSHTILMLELERTFGIEIDISRVSGMPNIGALVEYIDGLLPLKPSLVQTAPFLYLSVNGVRYAIDPLHCFRLNVVVLEITSKCNLRCIFCPKSIEGYNDIAGHDMEMPAETVENVYAFLGHLGPAIISLVGVGEPTFRKDWVQIFGRLLSLPGVSLHLNTNLGRQYSNEEVAALLKAREIIVSVESADMETQKRLRKAVDLRTILHNVLRLKSMARATGAPRPRLVFNCTVSDRNVFGVAELAALAREVGVDQVNFSSLYELEGVYGIRSIEHLDGTQLAEARNAFDRAHAILHGGSTGVMIHARLQQLLNGETEDTVGTPLTTRVCLQPWSIYTVAADGRVYPCCVTMESFTNIAAPAEEIFNGPAIRNLRRRLLVGDLPEMCRHCSNAPLGATDQLLQSVVSLALNTGRVPILP